MGVKDLWKLLESSGCSVRVESLQGLVLAVDISIWLNQAVKGMRDEKGEPVSNAHLILLFHRICKLLYFHIKPVFVFDGATPILKQQTLALRHRQRSKASERSVMAAERRRTKYLQAKILEQMTGQKSKVSVSNKQQEEPDMFQLPPMPKEDENFAENVVVCDNSPDAESAHHYSMAKEDLASLDLDSKDFTNLPPDVQHEILLERQQVEKYSYRNPSSLPQKAEDFSNYQLSKLLSSSRTSRKLENVRKVLKSNDASVVTLGEESLVHEVESEKIASSDSAHYILVKGLDMESQSISSQTDEETLSQSNVVDLGSESGFSGMESDQKKLGKSPLVKSREAFVIDLLSDSDDSGGNGSDDDFVSIVKGGGVVLEKSDDSCRGSELEDLVDNMETQAALMADIQESFSREANEKEGEGKGLPNLVAVEEANFKESFLPSTSAVIPSSPSTSAVRPSSLSTSTVRPPSPSTSAVRPSSPTTSAVRSPSPSTSAVRPSSPSTSAVRPSSPSTSAVRPSSPSTSAVRPSSPSTSAVRPSSPTTSAVRPSSPSTSAVRSPSPSTSAVRPSSPSTSAVRPPPPSTPATASPIPTPIPLASHLMTNSNPHASVSAEVTKRSGQEDLLSKARTSDDEDEGSEESGGDEMAVLVEMDAGAAQEMLREEAAGLERERTRQSRAAAGVSNQMYKEAQELLSLFGLPYVMSPEEAEAQCAALESSRLTQGSITDDSDIFLFGGKTVYRNFFSQSKELQVYKSEEMEKMLSLSRERLVLLAYLLGSDYTQGLDGVGVVGAMELLRDFPGNKLQPLQKFKKWHEAVNQNPPLPKNESALQKKLRELSLSLDFPSSNVWDAYMSPEVDSSMEDFEWGTPDLDMIRSFAGSTMGWEAEKVDELLLPVLRRMREREQPKITHFFARRGPTVLDQRKGIRSKRIRNAVTRIQSQDQSLREDTLSSEDHVTSIAARRSNKRQNKSSCRQVAKKTKKEIAGGERGRGRGKRGAAVSKVQRSPNRPRCLSASSSSSEGEEFDSLVKDVVF